MRCRKQFRLFKHPVLETFGGGQRADFQRDRNEKRPGRSLRYFMRPVIITRRFEDSGLWRGPALIDSTWPPPLSDATCSAIPLRVSDNHDTLDSPANVTGSAPYAANCDGCTALRLV
ncbi:hypothetical protein An02g01930 [Aspergillus niger]|uniref:Uncharacterized protein n=2 Tax=Aspergillus niger TaxID=5061 RepID=A2QC14_ASPNC|nr:hypothetical protein An02g01930 [Aspergillus niger]CAK37495.1 hypothetical protein An02g01930 [Aspergillus niger]